MSVSPRALAFSIAVAATLLAGCLGDLDGGKDGQAEPEAEPDSYQRSGTRFPVFPVVPIVVYETDNVTELIWEFDFFNTDPTIIEFCEEEENTTKNYLVLFDKNGFVWDKYTTFDYGDGNASMALEIEGEPPYLIAGSNSMCFSGRDRKLFGVKNGTIIRKEGVLPQEYLDSMDPIQQLPVQVPVGETRVEVEWDPGIYMTALMQVVLESREGVRNGQIGLYNKWGEEIIVFSYPLVGPSDFWGGSIMRYPGPYTIVLELEAPATPSTEWVLGVKYREMNEGVCLLGFEWEFCD